MKMKLFGKRKPANVPFVAPQGVTTAPQTLVRRAPFIFVEDGRPAISLSKEIREDPKHVTLVKGFDAMKKALEDAGLAGLRCEIIVIMDDSGSIQDQWEALLKLLVLYLGAALNLSPSGKIIVILYGRPNDPITITRENYRDVGTLLRPTWGLTPMGATFRKALQLAKANNCLTEIANFTDGNPYPESTSVMTNAVIESSGEPVIVKNWATKEVPYLQEIDNLPSQIEIEKDAGGNPVKDDNGNLKLYLNENGIRLIDNVDSQSIPDPHSISNAEFAACFAEEKENCIEVMAHAGILTGVPGHSRTF